MITACKGVVVPLETMEEEIIYCTEVVVSFDSFGSIALALWVWAVLGGACVCELFALLFLVSAPPFLGSSLPALRGARRVLAVRVALCSRRWS